MLRFYLIAAIIVVGFGSFVFAHRLVTHYGTVRIPKSPHASATGNGNAGFVTTPEPSFVGQGPWVMSALPSCFTQQSSKEGPSPLMTGDVPQDALRIAPGTTLHRGNCTVLVRDHDIWVYRGRDRLRVPPEARLYDGPQGLTLVYRHGDRTQVRVY